MNIILNDLKPIKSLFIEPCGLDYALKEIDVIEIKCLNLQNSFDLEFKYYAKGEECLTIWDQEELDIEIYVNSKLIYSTQEWFPKR